MSVLVGFTPTPEGRAAVRHAVRECHLRGGILTIMVSRPRPTSLAEAGEDAAAPVAEPVGTADLDALLAECGAAELERRVHDVDPMLDLADQLLDVAQDTGVELIVIGLRRRTPAGKLILGSSAQRIMLEASCPVLTVTVDRRSGLREPVAAVDRA